MKKLIPIVLLVAVVAGTAWWWWHRDKATENGTLRLYGNVDIRETQLGFRVAGRIQELIPEEGDIVHAGDVLARLDDAPYRRDAEAAAASVESAKARLQLLEAGNRPQEVTQARAVVREREVTAANAERVYKRQEELLSGRAISQQERDDAEALYREAEARLNSSRAQLSLLEAGFREEEIVQARAELARAKAAAAASDLRVADSVLKAPVEGVVLTRAQEPGTFVGAGASVITLSLRKPVWVRAYVSEPTLGRVPPGTPVRVFTDSRPGHAYAGKVGFVSPRAEFTPKTVETPELRTSLVYRVRIVVTDPDEQLLQGMPVTVEVSGK
jgi:HlyD family secretion protein